MAAAERHPSACEKGEEESGEERGRAARRPPGLRSPISRSARSGRHFLATFSVLGCRPDPGYHESMISPPGRRSGVSRSARTGAKYKRCLGLQAGTTDSRALRQLLALFDPKWTFGASNTMIARRAESETSSLRVRLCFTLRPPRPSAHRASSLSRVLASFRSSVSKPSVNQPYTGARRSWACCRLSW
jgi:hypothetical protein